jgi:lipopolysaccharide transport system permease protein
LTAGATSDQVDELARAVALTSPRTLRIDGRHRWFPELRDLANSRDLLRLLSKRQITVTYRQTVLGPAWVFISPLLTAGLFTFVFNRVAKLSDGSTPYFAFAYAGLLGWNVFAVTLGGVAASLNANSALISKIYFPRLVLPLATLSSTVIQLVVSSGVMAVVLLLYQIGPTWRIVLLPVWLLLAILLALSAGLILTAVSVKYRDINAATPLLIPLFLYLAPVAYPTESVPGSLRDLFLINPIATIVEGCRWSILGHGYLSGWAIVLCVTTTMALGVLSLSIFARLEWSFADVI